MGPPSTIPSALPPPRMVEMRPTPPATLSSGNSSRMIPNDRGKTAPAVPWTTLATIMTVTEVARAPDDGGGDGGTEQEGGEQPGDRRLRGVQVALEAGQRRKDERLEQAVRESPERERHEREPVAPAVAGRAAGCVRGHQPSVPPTCTACPPRARDPTGGMHGPFPAAGAAVTR